jgi:hypothetical protein
VDGEGNKWQVSERVHGGIEIRPKRGGQSLGCVKRGDCGQNVNLDLVQTGWNQDSELESDGADFGELARLRIEGERSGRFIFGG